VSSPYYLSQPATMPLSGTLILRVV